jgi:diguanylate cyclase (GGDEF)-like protein
VVQDYVFPFEEFQPAGNLTVSMGISGFPEDADSAEELIDRADRALYRAKLTGRNRICLYDPALDHEAFHPHVPR